MKRYRINHQDFHTVLSAVTSLLTVIFRLFDQLFTFFHDFLTRFDRFVAGLMADDVTWRQRKRMMVWILQIRRVAQQLLKVGDEYS